jgi:hypothetical protein
VGGIEQNEQVISDALRLRQRYIDQYGLVGSVATSVASLEAAVLQQQREQVEFKLTSERTIEDIRAISGVVTKLVNE